MENKILPRDGQFCYISHKDHHDKVIACFKDNKFHFSIYKRVYSPLRKGDLYIPLSTELKRINYSYSMNEIKEWSEISKDEG